MIWRTAIGRWNVTESEYKGREFVPVNYEMARVRSDAAGRLQAFKTPEDFGFNHDIVLQQGDRLMTQVAYSIDMSVDVSPRSGPLGTPITIDVKGIGYRSLEMSFNLLRQSVDRLDLRGYDARVGAVDDSSDGPRRRPRDRSAARPVRVPVSEPGAESRAGLDSRFRSPSPPVLQSLPPPPAAQAQTHVRLQTPTGICVRTRASPVWAKR